MEPEEIIEYSGGRAGLHEYGWLKAGYELKKVELLRQELLNQNDVGKIQQGLAKLGIRVKRDIIQAVKSYNFDSQGLGFTVDNYTAWRRLATERGTIGDVAYLVHEITELQELQRIQREVGFRFMGPKNWTKLSSRKRRQWKSDFRRYYLPSHSDALEAEYKFLAEQINEITKGEAKISFLQAAAIDPTRDEEALTNLFVDGVRMQEHRNFDAWSRRADEMITLSTNTQQKLGYYLPKIPLRTLIRFVKNVRIS